MSWGLWGAVPINQKVLLQHPPFVQRDPHPEFSNRHCLPSFMEAKDYPQKELWNNALFFISYVQMA
jgi:hypothetical protein